MRADGNRADARSAAAVRNAERLVQIQVRDIAAELAGWTALHQQIDALAADQREVVELLFYQGLNQAETALELLVSVKTVQRDWAQALYLLGVDLNGGGDR